jgi:hypothetical protein
VRRRGERAPPEYRPHVAAVTLAKDQGSETIGGATWSLELSVEGGRWRAVWLTTRERPFDRIRCHSRPGSGPGWHRSKQAAIDSSTCFPRTETSRCSSSTPATTGSPSVRLGIPRTPWTGYRHGPRGDPAPAPLLGKERIEGLHGLLEGSARPSRFLSEG